MATSVLVSLIVLISFYGFQVDGKVDRYAFNIVEKGTSFTEEVEVDVENKTEVIRVPRHNNVDALEILNDFDAGLSARRLPATEDCYVSKLDSSFPSPAKLKLDMDQVSMQSLPDKVETKRTGWRMVGFSDRSALPEKILDFCGSFPIYNVEAVPLDSMNVTLHRASGHGRKKRHHWIGKFKACDEVKDKKKFNDCLNHPDVGPFKITLSCKYDMVHCFYIAECRHVSPTVGQLSADYLCKKIVHHYNYESICCWPSNNNC